MRILNGSRGEGSLRQWTPAGVPPPRINLLETNENHRCGRAGAIRVLRSRIASCARVADRGIAPFTTSVTPAIKCQQWCTMRLRGDATTPDQCNNGSDYLRAARKTCARGVMRARK
ncbi:unnamed protein product [Leptosia nina]|uniref:Uncharacterized protein n=1 Tax=Leptosia nina TaxID=320188 RepID=A0AAV1JTX1_9NEOP